MDLSLVQEEQTTHPRPVGVIQPSDERAVRALAAIADKRIPDAEKHIAAMSDSPLANRAWKLLLDSLVSIERGHLSEAEPPLLMSSSLAFIGAFGTDVEPNIREVSFHCSESSATTDMLRLAARALHHLGRVYRRQDRPYDASRTHLAAYHLCEQHGSYEELWKTATELGLDADIARRYEEGQRWHRLAIEAAEKASDEPACKQAVAWANFSTSLTESGKHEEAVSAARTARDRWREHDMGAVTATQADLKLGGALLKQGESLHERSDKFAKPVLEEASEWLTTAHEALLAFGSEGLTDAESCRQQQDFAQRLLASVDY